MTPVVTVRRATLCDLPALTALKSRVWGGRDMQEWEARWPWQFAQHPAGREGETTFVVAEVDGALAGGIGWIPARVFHRGSVLSTGFACDIFVDPTLQRAGLGKHLVEGVRAACPLALFMNPSPGMLRFLERHGFIEVVALHEMAAVLDAGALLAAKAGWPGRIAGNLAGGLQSAVHALRGGRRPEGLTIEAVAPSDDEMETLSARACPAGVAAPVRDAGFFHWRFGDVRSTDEVRSAGKVRSTDEAPHWLQARRSGELVAAAAYRMRERPSGRLGVVDAFLFHPDRPAEAAALAREMLAQMTAAGGVAARILAPLPAVRKVLGRAGFLPTRRSPRLFLAPGAPQEAGWPVNGRQWELQLVDGDLDLS